MAAAAPEDGWAPVGAINATSHGWLEVTMSQAVFRFAKGASSGARSGGGIVARLVHAIATEWRYGRDLASLQRLDRRELGDIGLGRGELAHAVRFGRAKHRSLHQEVVHRAGVAGTFADMPVSMTEWR